MERIPASFTKVMNLVWHFIGIPVFFFMFLLVYQPFDTDTILEAGRTVYGFNLTMVSCIAIVSIFITRMCFFFRWRKQNLSYLGYAFWCVWEIVFFSFFFALYLWLIGGKSQVYFYLFGVAFEISILTMMIPYVVIALILTLFDMSRRLNMDSADESLVRFSDSNKRQKLVIASSAIIYIAAEENYVHIYYLEGNVVKDYVLRNSMKGIEDLVSSHGLVRCQRSYFINPAHVKVLRKDKEGVILAEFDANTRAIPVSKKYYDQLSALL